MHASRYMLASTWLLLQTANAIPAASKVARAAANPTDPWVTVEESGQPKTVTPVLTTISGTPTIISGAPNDVTGTVFTRTSMGEVSTRTGDPPIPTATATGGAGSFPVCHNKDGDKAPFCLPTMGTSLYPGTTYYITWDPTFFNGTNTTVEVIANYFNTSTGDIMDQAYSCKTTAAWSFCAWTVDSKILTDKSTKAVNISLSIAALQPGAGAMTPFTGPTVLVTRPPTYLPPKATAPTGPALYIGLPTVLGFVALVLIGTCLWNRHSRRIGLGNIMSRSRHGYGVGKSRRQRIRLPGRGRRERKEQAIRLMDQDGGASAAGAAEEARRHEYHDTPDPAAAAEGHAARGGATGWRQEVPGRDESFDFGLPRRDSDALGSLAGTPTEDRRMDLGHPDGGNAFRDELSRQDRERW